MCAFFNLLNKRKRISIDYILFPFFFSMGISDSYDNRIHSPLPPQSLTHSDTDNRTHYQLFTVLAVLKYVMVEKLKKSHFFRVTSLWSWESSDTVVKNWLAIGKFRRVSSSTIHAYFHPYALYTSRSVIKTYKNLYMPGMKSSRFAWRN